MVYSGLHRPSAFCPARHRPSFGPSLIMANPQRLRGLTIDDLGDDAVLLVRKLRSESYEPAFRRVGTREAMDEALETETWDLIPADYKMPRFNGLSAPQLVKGEDLDIPFIIVSGTIGESVAVGAMLAGVGEEAEVYL